MKNILVIEDDQGINELISEKIQMENCNIKSFYYGIDALEWLKKNKTYLIILDYGLPDMNGTEFISKMKNTINNSVPFIVSTGQGDERIAVEMMKLGARDYVIKDANFLELITIVTQQVCHEIENEIKITEIQETLNKRESYLSAIIDNLPGLIWLKDKESRFLMTNDKFAKFCGKNSVDEIIGCNEHDLWNKKIADAYVSEDKIVINSKKPLKLEECKNINGDDKFFDIFKTPIFDENYNVIGTAGYAMDISEYKNTTEKLSKKIDELKFMNSMMINRELKMVELKKEINELLVKFGLEKKYD